MLVLRADHRTATSRPSCCHPHAAEAAEKASCYLRIVAATPETGYGYIRKGASLPGCAGAYQVAGFVEKPDQDTAQQYVASGDYFWNSGMFLFRAADFLDELQTLRPDILEASRAALDAAVPDLDFVRLDPVAFEACRRNRSLRGDGAYPPRPWLPGTCMKDIGAWSALWEVAVKDAQGNAPARDVMGKTPATTLSAPKRSWWRCSRIQLVGWKPPTWWWRTRTVQT